MQDVPKIVRARLQQTMPLTVESHPDADLLTAFAEQAVAGEERERMLRHLALCGDCRDIVALALPATEALTVATLEGATRTGWLRWPVLRWSFVAAGIILVSSVGILQYQQRHAEKMGVATTLAPHNQVDDITSPRIPSSAQTPVSRSTSPSVEIGKPMETGSKTATHPRSAFVAKQRDRSANSGSVAGGNGDSQENEATPQLEAQASAEQFEAVAKAKSAVTQAPSATMAPAPMLRANPKLMHAQTAALWTVSSTGALQRSLDAGRTWQDVNVTVDDSTKSKAVPTIFRTISVSADASEVWVGGSDAALYHTIDGGKRWTRVVPSSASAIFTGGIVDIQFSNPQNGTVTTATSEIWTTTDAGQTWRKQP
jgi:hypothetical protein